MSIRTMFTDRATAVAEAFDYSGLAPAHATAMADADAEVSSRVQALASKLAGPSREDLQELATAAVSGKAADVKALREALISTEVSRSAGYTNAVQAAAQAVRADLDTPEWAVAALISALAPEAQAYMDGVASTAVESLQALPATVRSRISAGTLHMAQMFNAVDPATVSGKELEAAQRATNAWSLITSGSRRFPYLAQAMTISQGRVVSEDSARDKFAQARRKAERQDTENPLELDTNMVWGDVQAQEAMAAGVGSLVRVVSLGLGGLEPLVDPLGDQAEDYAQRREARRVVVTWLESKADAARGILRRHPSDYSTGGDRRPAYKRAGYSTAAEALAAYRQVPSAVDSVESAAVV